MSESKKILIVTPLYPPDIGGPATYSKLLEKELPLRGFSIEVLKFGKFLKYPYIIRHILFFFTCLKAAANFDVVYALDPLGVGLPSGVAARVLGKKFIIKIVGDRAWETARQRFGSKEMLDDFVERKFYFSLIFLVRVGQKLAAHLAHKIVVPSNYLKKIVVSWGVNPDKIGVIHNTFYDVHFEGEKLEIRKKLGLEGNIILSAGRLELWKGFGTLIEVVSEIEGARLLIAGKGLEEENLRRQVELLKDKNKVVLLGELNKNDLYSYLKASDLFVLNTGYEGLSHVLLEAMSLGLPIITTNIGGNPELIDDGINGLLVLYNDKAALKSSIIKVLHDKQLQAKFGEAAKQKSKQFSVERAVGDLTKLIETL